jgi:hypothetical protein
MGHPVNVGPMNAYALQRVLIQPITYIMSTCIPAPYIHARRELALFWSTCSVSPVAAALDSQKNFFIFPGKL